MAKEDVKKTNGEVVPEETTESKQKTTDEEEVPEIVVDKPKKTRKKTTTKKSTSKSKTSKKEKEETEVLEEPKDDESEEKSELAEEKTSNKTGSTIGAEEINEELDELLESEMEESEDDSFDEADEEDFSEISDEEIIETLKQSAAINNIDDDNEELDEEVVEENIIDVENMENDYERRVVKETGADFFQTLSGSKTRSHNEIKNILQKAITTRNILLAEIIGTDIADEDCGSIKKGTAYVECKIKNSLFKDFTVYVPYNFFFTHKEKAYNNRVFKSKYIQNASFSKERVALSLYKGFVTLVLTENIDDNTFVGSRTMALVKRERICFEIGQVVNGKVKVAGEGSVIKKCNINKILPKEIRVEVAGIPTRIPIEEIHWQYISKPGEVLNYDDTVDVKILEVNIDKRNRRSLKCSIKRTRNNYTIPSLIKYTEQSRLGRAGDVKATIKRMVERPRKEGSAIPNFVYLIHTDRGYNAVANSVDIFNKFASDIDELPGIGDRVIFRPVKRLGDVCRGYIPEIIKKAVSFN